MTSGRVNAADLGTAALLSHPELLMPALPAHVGLTPVSTLVVVGRNMAHMAAASSVKPLLLEAAACKEASSQCPPGASIYRTDYPRSAPVRACW